MGSTDALIATDVEVSTANATVVLSISVPPDVFVVIRTNVLALSVVGLVILVKGTAIAVPDPIDAGEVTVRVMVPLLEKFEVLALSPVSDP